MTRSSTIVRTAALAMMGTTLAIFPAAAQQMAANIGSGSTADFSRCDAMHASNPKGAITCRVEVLQAHTRQMQQESEDARRQSAQLRQQSAEAREEGSCADAIKSEIAAGRIKPENLRAALAGRSAREVGACNLFNILTRL